MQRFMVATSFSGVASAAAVTAAAACSTQTVGTDYPYGDILMTTTATADECCELCGQTSGCKLWVWSPGDSTGGGSTHCWLKHTVNGAVSRSDRVSGTNAPAQKWSDKYRGWTYYTGGDHDGFVIPPSPVDPATGEKIANGKLTDCAIAWQAAVESSDSATFRMFYTTFDGTGYRTAMAKSSNLLDWDFSPGVIFDRGGADGLFDYGGVTFGCPLYENASITAPRTLRKHKGKYWVAYGAYPSRTGYEEGSGGEGIAWSLDGDTWHRESVTVPILSITGADAWESEVVYQPNLVEHNGKVYDFYNAKGQNNQGAASVEESGVATIDLDAFPGIDHSTNISYWQRYGQNPIIPNGLPGSFDTRLASDPKVWWDDELGCWLMFYFGLGDGSGGHADIMIARSDDLLTWEKDTDPLYRAGAHPNGIDGDHAHKISLLYHKGVGYLFYTAVGAKGRGIALLTSKQLPPPSAQHEEVV